MRITEKVALEVACHEGIVRQAYKDSVGIWTWSVGITSMSGHKVERYIDNPQTMAKCLEVWIWLMEEKYAPAVRAAFPNGLTEAQFAAALSFHWNTGAILKASWVKHWNAGELGKAKKAFMNWSKPSEIIPRRQAERDLFFEGIWSNDGKMTEYTRVRSSGTPDWSSAQRVDVSEALSSLLSKPEEKPKEPRKSIAQSTTLQATATTAVAGAGGVFTALAKLDPQTQMIVAGCGAVALVGLGWIARERIRKWARGDR